MKKILLLTLALALGACTFPSTPTETNLLNGAKQHRAELFESGARGEVILSMSDNVSDDGWFGKNYENKVAFKNIHTGEMYFLRTKLDDRDYDWAMLPIGEYEVTNLYLEYVYTTSERQGNMTVVTTHVETIAHFEGGKNIRFRIKPGEITYVGNFEMVKAENKVDAEGRHPTNSFKIEDRSAKIPERQKKIWEKEFGRDYVVRLATVE